MTWVGKRSFPSKAAAKRVARTIDRTLRPYRCDGPAGGWHLCHLASVVRQGHLDKAEWLANKEAS